MAGFITIAVNILIYPKKYLPFTYKFNIIISHLKKI